MTRKECKNFIDTVLFQMPSDQSIHPKRVAKRTEDDVVYRLFSLHGNGYLVELVEKNNAVASYTVVRNGDEKAKKALFDNYKSVSEINVLW